MTNQITAGVTRRNSRVLVLLLALLAAMGLALSVASPAHADPTGSITINGVPVENNDHIWISDGTLLTVAGEDFNDEFFKTIGICNISVGGLNGTNCDEVSARAPGAVESFTTVSNKIEAHAEFEDFNFQGEPQPTTSTLCKFYDYPGADWCAVQVVEYASAFPSVSINQIITVYLKFYPGP